jgi:hypothetical protein
MEMGAFDGYTRNPHGYNPEPVKPKKVKKPFHIITDEACYRRSSESAEEICDEILKTAPKGVYDLHVTWIITTKRKEKSYERETRLAQLKGKIASVESHLKELKEILENA